MVGSLRFQIFAESFGGQPDLPAYSCPIGDFREGVMRDDDLHSGKSNTRTRDVLLLEMLSVRSCVICCAPFTPRPHAWHAMTCSDACSRKRASRKRVAWARNNPEKRAVIQRRYNRKHSGVVSGPIEEGCSGVCPICPPGSGPQWLAFDHDHATGQFRGWLCHKHNRSLGLFDDSIEGLERAIAYLRGCATIGG